MVGWEGESEEMEVQVKVTMGERGFGAFFCSGGLEIVWGSKNRKRIWGGGSWRIIGIG